MCMVIGCPEYIGDGFKNGLKSLLHENIFLGLVIWFTWNLYKLTKK